MERLYDTVTIGEAKSHFISLRPRPHKIQVNLFCRISAISLAFHANRGTDYCRTLKLIDTSCPSSALSVVFFARHPQPIANIISVGDIISIENVEMTAHDGEIFCCSNKTYSTYALFSGVDGFDPYATSEIAHGPNHAHEKIAQLRTLSLGRRSASGLTDHLLKISDIQTVGLFDLVCKVFHMHRVSDDEWMLYVWDGTDSPPATFDSNMDMEKENPSPLHLEAVPLARETLCTFPHVGTVLRISIYKHFEDMYRLQSGLFWIKICNIGSKLQSGLWKGVMESPRSNIFLLSEDDYSAQTCIKIHRERMSSKLFWLPWTCFLQPLIPTALDDKHLEYSTLISSLATPEVIHEFRCLVRVVASYPWQGGDLCDSICRCQVKLTLEDPTARIHAYIDDKDGVEFFGHDLTTVQLIGKMSKLLGIVNPSSMIGHSASRNPPWLRCCLRSVYTDESDPSGGRKYWIIKTRLLG